MTLSRDADLRACAFDSRGTPDPEWSEDKTRATLYLDAPRSESVPSKLAVREIVEGTPGACPEICRKARGRVAAGVQPRDGRPLYKNGERIAAGQRVLAPDVARVGLGIADPWGHGNRFAGEIREFKVLRAPLTRERLTALQQSRPKD